MIAQGKRTDKRTVGAAKNRTRAFYVISSIKEARVPYAVESILRRPSLGLIVTEDVGQTPSLVQAEGAVLNRGERSKWKRGNFLLKSVTSNSLPGFVAALSDSFLIRLSTGRSFLRRTEHGLSG